MKPRKQFKLTQDQKLKAIQHEAQFWANVTQLPTKAVRSADGMVRFTREDAPMAGEFLTIQVPQQREMKEAA